MHNSQFSSNHSAKENPPMSRESQQQILASEFTLQPRQPQAEVQPASGLGVVKQDSAPNERVLAEKHSSLMENFDNIPI